MLRRSDLGVAEFIVRLHARVLLFFPVDAGRLQVHVVKQLVVELDAHTAAEKHHYLLVSVLLQKRKEEQEAVFCRAYNESLL